MPIDREITEDGVVDGGTAGFGPGIKQRTVKREAAQSVLVVEDVQRVRVIDLHQPGIGLG
ncbi:MAG: hypothetical protein U0232_26810 [Thermomicrobiales bacterium]